MHLPGWWVRAYDAAVIAEGTGDSAMELACAAGLAPALSPLELHALAMVLGNLQAQLLTGTNGPLIIQSEEHLKHAGTAARSRRFIFEKIIQVLTGLRLLRAGEDAQERQSGTLQSYSLFRGDQWRRDGASGEFVVELSLAELGPELLLGLADAHIDLHRFCRNESEGAEILGRQPPLTIWRSIWLELQGYEQLVHLRMERSMQWEFRWLRLEGVFGVPLATLFGGLRLPTTRGSELDGELSKRLKFLVRLGRKLEDHGFLTAEAGAEYLALGGGEGHHFLLTWQASRERLASNAATAYRALFADSMLRSRYAPAAATLPRLCLHAEALQSSSAAAAHRSWQELSALATPVSAAHLELKAGQMLTPQALFYEYSLRQLPGSLWPIPELLAMTELAATTAPGATAPLAERFQGFCRVLSDDAENTRALREMPHATLASEASRADLAFAAFARGLRRGDPGAASWQHDALRAEAAPAIEAARPVLPTPAAAETKPRLVAPKDVGELGPGPSEAAPPQRRQAAVSGALASRMLKIASDELAKIRASDYARYDALKQGFLGSLDDSSRRLLLDVQKRIQPTMFEEQLRQRLVRYMVENPGAWRSAEPSKAGSP